MSHDGRREAADDAAEQMSGRRVSWLQIPLNPERRHTRSSPACTRMVPRRAPIRGEAPAASNARITQSRDLLDQRHPGLGARAADVEVDRAEQAARAQVLDVMANGGRLRIGKVKRIRRPTTASKGAGARQLLTSLSTKVTCRSPASSARRRATASASPDSSIPTTAPPGPTSSPASRATCPRPVPRSRTRMPRPTPAAWSSRLRRPLD